jgi:hypothetical protein
VRLSDVRFTTVGLMAFVASVALAIAALREDSLLTAGIIIVAIWVACLIQAGR